MTLSILWGPSVVTSVAPTPAVAGPLEMLRYTKIRNNLYGILTGDMTVSRFDGRDVTIEREADLDTPDKAPWINLRIRREERITRRIAAGIKPYDATVLFDIEVAIFGMPQALDPSDIEDRRDNLMNLVEEVILAPDNLTQPGYWDLLTITGARFEGFSGFLEENQGFIAAAAIELQITAST